MRFVSYKQNGVASLGALNGERIFANSDVKADLASLLAAGDDALKQAHMQLLAGEEIDPSGLHYLAPIASP